MKSRQILALLLVSCLAALAHGYLLIQHYQLHFGGLVEKSICNINATWNCDAVAASPYSSLWGLPVAALGLVTHLVWIWLIFRLWLADAEDRAQEARANFLLSVVSVLGTIVMGTISVSALKVFCIFCFSTYALSLVAFGLSWSLARSDIKDWSIQEIRSAPVVGILAIPLLAMFLHSVWSRSWTKSFDRIVKESIDYWKTANPQEVPMLGGLTAGSPTESTKMTIVEFADFQCIHCKMAGPTLHAFIASRPDVRIIFYPFPLDGKCNPAITRSGDGLSCKLAKLALCAEKTGQGFQAHDWLFDRFGEWPVDVAEKLARDLKLDLGELEKCVGNESTQQQLLTIAELGKKVGVEGTPTILVNGRPLPRGQLLGVLQAAYSEITK